MYRSSNFLGLLGPKKTVDGYEISKRLMLIKSSHKLKKPLPEKIKLAKLPSIKSAKQFVLTG